MGVLQNAMNQNRLRLVTHLDIDDHGVERAIEAFQQIAGN
jgi:threonine aldolase